MPKTTQLPDNIADLQALLSAQRVEMAALTAERDLLREEKNDDLQQIQRLTLLIDKLRRMLFGRKSEKLMQQIEQLQLELEELHINQGERTQQAEATVPDKPVRSAPHRRPLPEHLPRVTQEHLPHDASCPDCG